MRHFLLAFALLGATAGAAHADKLIVGTHPVPPFVIKHDDGSFGGISVELWRILARRLGLDYEIREYSIPEMLAGGHDHEIDVLVSVNITADREDHWDLTHAFFYTGLAIAIRPSDHGGWSGTLQQVFTWRLLAVVVAIV